MQHCIVLTRRVARTRSARTDPWGSARPGAPDRSPRRHAPESAKKVGKRAVFSDRRTDNLVRHSENHWAKLCGVTPKPSVPILSDGEIVV